jgi:sensor histidine kinase YesM
MKKTIIAALVGGIIIFIWQFLSWSLINLHQPAQQHTPKQGAIMDFLNSQQLDEGGYFMPGFPDNASMDEMKQMMKHTEGKPWASIQYHKAMNTNMAMNMIRGLLVNIIAVFLLCWILVRMASPSFGRILTASLFTGLLFFLMLLIPILFGMKALTFGHI